MKLFFAIKTLSLAGGGAERVLADVASSLAERGHQVTVASYDPAGAADFYAFHPAVHRVRLGIGSGRGPTRIGQLLRRMLALRREARRIGPDVAIGFMHSAYLPLGLALAGSGIPVVASEHTVYGHYAGRPLERLALRAVPWLCDAATNISQEARRGFPAGLSRRMRTIPNPVAVSPRRLADPAGDERIVLAVGGLREEKRHDLLIEAFARVAPRFPQWRLRIVGEGPLRRPLEAQIAASGLDRRVALPGATADIDREYMRAQLFVMPSAYESFGLATAEALAHGLPAIGFADCPGTNELIVAGENGLLVSGPDPVAALAAGLARLIAAPEERARMGAAAPARVAVFAPERVIGAWERLLAELRGVPGPVPEVAATAAAGGASR